MSMYLRDWYKHDAPFPWGLVGVVQWELGHLGYRFRRTSVLHPRVDGRFYTWAATQMDAEELFPRPEEARFPELRLYAVGPGASSEQVLGVLTGLLKQLCPHTDFDVWGDEILVHKSTIASVHDLSDADSLVIQGRVPMWLVAALREV